MGLLWGSRLPPVDLVLLVAFYIVCAFGTTIGFHRYFTHRGFETRPPVKATLGHPRLHDDAGPDHCSGSPTTASTTRSPTSPATRTRRTSVRRRRCSASSRASLHAHVGWMFTNLGIEQGRDVRQGSLRRPAGARDRPAVPGLGRASRSGFPFAIGYAIGGTFQAGIEGLVWGGLLRVFLYQHATFSVNSICHMFGRQDYRSRDEARNNWLVALLVFGEGWHNNHHAFPARRATACTGGRSTRRGGSSAGSSGWARLGREGARRAPARAARAFSRRA